MVKEHIESILKGLEEDKYWVIDDPELTPSFSSVLVRRGNVTREYFALYTHQEDALNSIKSNDWVDKTEKPIDVSNSHLFVREATLHEASEIARNYPEILGIAIMGGVGKIETLLPK